MGKPAAKLDDEISLDWSSQILLTDSSSSSSLFSFRTQPETEIKLRPAIILRDTKKMQQSKLQVLLI